MKINRPMILGLFLFFVLLITGCAIQTSSPTTEPVALATNQAAPTATVATEPMTVTTALTTTTAEGVADDAIQDTFNLPVNANGYADLSADQLHQILPAHKFTLVNVHIPYQGEIPETNLFIPFDKIADHQAELPAKDAPIVLYCKTGPMSVDAAKTLVGLGYSHIYTLKGGFDAWGAAKYELLNKK